MSSEAVGWVFRYSPYRGAAFQIHLAIADSVNDQYGYELWMRQKVLATKARVSRKATNEALAKMEADGLLHLLEQGSGGANRYRFMMPDLALIYDPRAVTVGDKGATRRDSKVSPPVTPPTHEGVTGGDTEPKEITQREPKGSGATADAAARIQIIDGLCAQLAEAIGNHHPPQPKVTARWRRDMRLLLERGPLKVDEPEPQTPAKVSQSISFLFTHLADPNGRDGFCWADQIRSPGALRDHWVQLRLAARRLAGATVGQGGQAVERAAARLGGDAPSAPQQRPRLGLLPGGADPKEEAG